MRISVIIPTYNRVALLARAVASVVNQQLSPHEIIVVDDGSTDATADWLRQHHPDIQLLQQPQRGVSAARNAGLRAATGDWLAWLDSDDAWQPQKLQRQVEALRAQPQYALCHCDETWLRAGRVVQPRKKHAKPHGWIFPQCLPLCCVSPSAILLKKSLIEAHGGFDEQLPACEDYDLWLRLFSRHPLLLVPEPLVIKYGGHADQLSRQYWGMDRFRITALLKLLAPAPHHPPLGARARGLTIATLCEKLTILLNGLAKRQHRADRRAAYQHYRAIQQAWCDGQL